MATTLLPLWREISVEYPEYAGNPLELIVVGYIRNNICHLKIYKIGQSAEIDLSSL